MPLATPRTKTRVTKDEIGRRTDRSLIKAIQVIFDDLHLLVASNAVTIDSNQVKIDELEKRIAALERPRVSTK